MLATFDPVATPARMVADTTLSTDEIVETFDLLESLSFRRPLELAIPHELDWALVGLATAFDR